MNESPSTPDDAIDELQQRWSQHECVQVEDLLKKHPHLGGNGPAVLDLIYSEVLLREERGQAVQEAEYLQRFPNLRDGITRQFQLHRALDDSSEQAERPTATGGITLPADDTVKPPKDAFPQITGFEILELAGRGGSGVAYRAYDQQLKRTVAIKLLHSVTSQDGVQKQQLIREAEAAASLVHPAIIQVHQIGETNGAPYLVMEYIDGQSLADVLREAPLPIEDAIEVVVAVAQAIDHAHSKGVIHRDIKPGNVLLDQDGRPYVCDFGLARQLDSEFTLHTTGDVVGTPAYMSPEQARGEPVTAASDVYSLGAVLYHCLTGRPPYQAATPWEIMTQVMTNDPPSVRQLNPAVPRDLETICGVALQKTASRRPASAGELADELERYRDGKPILSRPTGRLEKLWKLCRRSPAITSLICVSVLAISAVAIISTISARQVSGALTQAESARDEASVQRDVAFDAMKNLIHEVHDTLQRREASIEARAEILTAAIKGLQQLIDTGSDREDIRIAMAEARNRYGYILTQQGRNSEAEKEYFQAADILEQNPSAEGMIEAAQTYCNLTIYYTRVAKPDPAIQMADKAIALAERIPIDPSENLRPLLIASRARAHKSSALAVKEQYDEALKVGLEALKIDRALLKRAPNERRVTTQLADMDLQIGRLYLQMGNIEEAEFCIAEAIPLIEAEASKSTEDAELSRRYHTAMHDLGKVQFSRMKYEEALINMNRAITGYQHLVDVEPDRPGYRLKLGSMHTTTISCLLALNRVDEAKTHTLKSIELFRKGMELGGHEYRVQRWAIYAGYMTLSDLQIRKGNLADSLISVRQALEELEPIVEEYKMADTVQSVTYLAEILAGMLSKESQASSEDVARVQRSYEVYRSAQNGDLMPLLTSETQLLADIDSTTQPVVSLSLMFYLCLTQGMYFEQMFNDKESSKEDIKIITEKVIQSSKRLTSMPGSDPVFYIGVPEMDAIRKMNEFRDAFGIE